MKTIAKIYNDYNSKFGIPRQSGIVADELSTVIFEPEYRVSEALRDIDAFNYLWLIWGFSECDGKAWSPTVRPPRLGGNKRTGVFATRSPFRPNSLGLSSVKLIEVKDDINSGKVLIVGGADLMNGTPIYDIKPYLKYADSHPDAVDGFALDDVSPILKVDISDEILDKIPLSKQKTLISVLAQDPRPQYIDEGEREYGMSFAGFNIKFTVEKGILTVTEIV